MAAAGTISFFGTKRIVELPMLEPSAMNEADVGALCDLDAKSGKRSACDEHSIKDDKASSPKRPNS